MKYIKSVLCAVLAIIIVLLPLSASADEINTQNTEKFSLDFICQINGIVPSDTKFTFSVTEKPIKSIDEIDGSIEYGDETPIDAFTVDTKKATDGKGTYTFPEKAMQGGFSYTMKLKSVSNRLAAASSIVIKVDFKVLPNENELIIDGVVLSNESSSDPLGIITGTDDDPITVNCDKKKEVKISTEGLTGITKVYDGNVAATVTDKNFKLTGIDEGDEVKLSFIKTEFNSPDVKKANKVIISGLTLTGKDADKYGIVAESYELKGSITPRPITVTADKMIMTLGDPEPTLTYTLSEQLIEGNKIVGSLTRAGGNDIGVYTVTRGTLMLGDNYTVTFVDGSLTISNYGFKEIIDDKTSVKISGHFDPKATVTVSALDPNGEIYSTLAAETSWGKILLSYDLIFTASDFDGPLSISIPVGSKFDGKTLTVYQQMSSGIIVPHQSVVENGFISFYTDECTQFMLVTEKDAVKSEESSIAWTIFKIILIIIAVIVGLAVVIILFFFGMIFFNKTEQLKSIIKAVKRILRK